MSARALLAAALVAVSGCGGDGANELRILAPVHVPLQLTTFERETGCRPDVRIYDEGEDVRAISRRRNVDVVAADRATLVRLGAAVQRRTPYTVVKLARVELRDGPTVTVPEELASAFDGRATPAASRAFAWAILNAGPNDDCARLWFRHVSAQ